MEGAGQARRASADDQDVGLKLFALYSHRFFSLAERTARWPQHRGSLVVGASLQRAQAEGRILP
jgi:hypothetical protein